MLNLIRSLIFKIFKKRSSSDRITHPLVENGSKAFFRNRKLLSSDSSDIAPSTHSEWRNILIEADFCKDISNILLESTNNYKDIKTSLSIMKGTMLKLLKDRPIAITKFEDASRLQIIVLLGVNGSGKTTFAGRIAHWISQNTTDIHTRMRFMFIAADNFRSAASEQLSTWISEKNDEHESFFHSGRIGQKPPSIVFDGIKSGIDHGVQFIFIDTAGRLPNNQNLMNELNSTISIIKKASADTPVDIHHLLVLDASFGKNALDQIELFNKIAPLSGCVVTKLDGPAHAGFIFSILITLRIPIWFASFGPSIDDIAEFCPLTFCENMFSSV